MRLTHRHIDVFRALMHTGQATRAAAALHTSQPTISRELARLEQVVGFTLFDRTAGRLRPTARALALLAEVERSYQGLQLVAERARALRDDAEGQLHLACLPALADTLLPEAVRRFAERKAQAAVAITALDNPGLATALAEQRFDLGLSEDVQAPPGTELQVLLRADEVAVLPSGHPLARRRVLSAADFAHQPFISLAPADPYRQQVDAQFEAAGVTRAMRLQAGSAAAICALVHQGLGLAIVNPLTALAWAERGLVMRPLRFQVPFTVALILPTLQAENPLRPAMAIALRETARAVQARLAQAQRHMQKAAS